jgi:hypothetical protein
MIFIVRNYESYLSSKDLDNLKQVNASYFSMILDLNVNNTLIFHFSRNQDLIIQHKSASPKIELT